MNCFMLCFVVSLLLRIGCSASCHIDWHSGKCALRVKADFLLLRPDLAHRLCFLFLCISDVLGPEVPIIRWESSHSCSQQNRAKGWYWQPPILKQLKLLRERRSVETKSNICYRSLPPNSTSSQFPLVNVHIIFICLDNSMIPFPRLQFSPWYLQIQAESEWFCWSGIGSWIHYLVVRSLSVRDRLVWVFMQWTCAIPHQVKIL